MSMKVLTTIEVQGVCIYKQSAWIFTDGPAGIRGGLMEEIVP